MPNNLVLPKAGSKAGSRSGSKASSASRAAGAGAGLPPGPAFATLALGKLSRVFAAFVSFHYLQDRVALPLYLFFVTAGAAVCLLSLQRPWTGRRIGAKRGKKVLLAGVILATTLYVWTAGLRSAGPLRTLLIDGAELPLLYLFAVVSRRELPHRRKTQGALCMLAAYLLLIWDASGHVPNIEELERTKLGHRAGMTIERLANKTSLEINHLAGLRKPLVPADPGEPGGGGRRRLLATYDPPVAGSGTVRDAFVEGTALRSEIGVILVLIASVMMQSSRAFTRRLATELGGAKRHFALSVSTACAWLSPLALLSHLSSSAGAVLSLSVPGVITRMPLTLTHTLGFLTVGFLWLVLPYYVRAIVSTSIPQRSMLQASVIIPFLMASAASAYLGASASCGGLSWILVAAFALDTVGISLMMRDGIKRSLSHLPLDTASSMGTAGSRSAE